MSVATGRDSVTSTETPHTKVLDTQPLEQSPRTKYVIFITALPLLCHVMAVAATACFVLVYLSNHDFGDRHRDRLRDFADAHKVAPIISWRERWTPLQSDMVTALSVLLVLVRFFLTLWCADVAWKSIFILLEKMGLSVMQINYLIQYKILRPSGLPRSQLPKKQWQVDHILVCLALLLPIPALLSAPIISGSLTWIPSYVVFPAGLLGGVTNYSSGLWWNAYNQDEEMRAYVLSEAAKDYHWLYNANNDAPLKRTLLAAIPHRYYVNANAANITIPFISLSNLTWITNLSSIPPDQLKAAHPTMGRLNITMGVDLNRNNQSLHDPPPFITLIPNEQWKPADLIKDKNQPARSADAKPKSIINQQFYLIYGGYVHLGERCDDLETTVGWFSVKNDDGSLWCFKFASVTVSAGVKTCNNCTIENSWSVSSGFTSLENQELLSDPSAEQAIWMAPQVIRAALSSGLANPSPWNKTGYNPYDLDTFNPFVNRTIIRGYCASWAALTDWADTPSSKLDTYVNDATASSKAIVNKARVYVWITFQVLPWLAAAIFIFAQQRCKRPLTGNTVLAAMFLDQHEDIQTDARRTGLSEVAIVSPVRHSRALGMLTLHYDQSSKRSQLRKHEPEAKGESEEEHLTSFSY